MPGRAVGTMMYRLLAGWVVVLLGSTVISLSAQQNTERTPTHYVRYASDGVISYGILEGDRIHELDGELFENPRPSGRIVEVSSVTILAPLDPLKITKVLGVGGNYNRPGQAPRVVSHPSFFAKFPTSIVTDGDAVETYPEATDHIWEGELVLVIGRKGRHITVEEAPEYIFGVAVGNDVSQRSWVVGSGGSQPASLLGKAADTWAVLGRSIVTGVNYNDLRITVKQNGVLVGDGRTSAMITKPASLVSYVSRYVTLMPGDLIYSGTVPNTPDDPDRIKAGDVIEVEIENVGKVTNEIVMVQTDAPK